MTSQESRTIPIILATTMGTQQWDLNLPTGVVVQAIIAKIVSTPGLPFREQDDTGRRKPYRLMWRQGDRYLREAETLGMAGVAPQDTLVMTQQARAGRRPGAR